MPAWTLLDYVQHILSDLDSDEVNSHSDTVESLQVSRLVAQAWEHIAARSDLNEHYGLFELDASGTIDRPVMMHRPSDIHSINWVMYNCLQDGETDPNWKQIKFLPIDEFLRITDQIKPSDDNTGTFDYTVNTATLTFNFWTNRAPTYYTSFDDSTLVFDAYDSEVDSTLQKTKTRCYGLRERGFTYDDDFVPFLDRDAAQLLLNEAKSLAFAQLKQVKNDKAEQWAMRGWTKIQKAKRGVDRERNELDRAPNYGRKC